ncbi:MAG: dimethylmenaquinone methyltransferase [Planctomycetaceae bacterium]|nr:dimethylmenaquinone methyltransferase [Planctomycetaceae bacterium]
MLSHTELLQLKRWNTPTIYNGWEQITSHNHRQDAFNLDETHDFMPQMGPMVGYAVTAVIEPSNPAHKAATTHRGEAYLRYMLNAPGPKIVVVQDLDHPRLVGSWWGEVNANTHRALGCVGLITNGTIRDIDEMTNAGFKAIAARLCVGHADAAPVRWNCQVEVFGRKIQPGQLIHADKHGFLAIPPEDEADLLDAAVFMDQNETQSVIPAARGPAGRTNEQLIKDMIDARKAFGAAVKEKFQGQGEF